MVNPAPIFEQVYKDYLRRLTQLDFPTLANRIGLEIKDGALIIPFFGQPYKVSPSGIVDASGTEPLHSLKVVFCQYLTAAENSQQSYLTGIIVIQAGIIEVFGLCTALESLDRQPL